MCLRVPAAREPMRVIHPTDQTVFRFRRTWPHLLALAALFSGVGATAQTSVVATHKDRATRFLAGRHLPGQASAAKALDAARREHQAMLAKQQATAMVTPQTSSLSAAWTAIGPLQVASQTFGAVTGRVTSLAIDPADSTGNTLYAGTTGGGVWKSTNAAGAIATFIPLTDTLPVFSTGTTASISIGALAIANGILLAGTGDPNDASDSYYGSGILRSADGGVTWTLAQQSLDGVAGNHSFFGLSVSGFAFSSANPSLVIAALGQAVEGDIVNAAPQNNAVKGLYYSTDAGLTWQMANIVDGSQTVQSPQLTGLSGGGNAATAVVWNAIRRRQLDAPAESTRRRTDHNRVPHQHRLHRQPHLPHLPRNIGRPAHHRRHLRPHRRRIEQ